MREDPRIRACIEALEGRAAGSKTATKKRSASYEARIAAPGSCSISKVYQGQQ